MFAGPRLLAPFSDSAPTGKGADCAAMADFGFRRGRDMVKSRPKFDETSGDDRLADDLHRDLPTCRLPSGN